MERYIGISIFSITTKWPSGCHIAHHNIGTFEQHINTILQHRSPSMKMKLSIATLAAIIGTATAQDTTVAAVSGTESGGSSDGGSSSPSVHLHGSGTTNPSKCEWCRCVSGTAF